MANATMTLSEVMADPRFLDGSLWAQSCRWVGFGMTVRGTNPMLVSDDPLEGEQWIPTLDELCSRWFLREPKLIMDEQGEP
jgi:hypothetical protein